MADETSDNDWTPPESDGEDSESAPSLPGASDEDTKRGDSTSDENGPDDESDSDSDEFELLTTEERRRRRTERRRQERRKERIQDYNRSMNSVPGHSTGGSSTPSSDRLTGDADDSDRSLNLFRQLDKLAHRRPKLYGALIVGVLVALLFLIFL